MKKKHKSYIPASSSAGYRASICNFPSSGQALSLSDVWGTSCSQQFYTERGRRGPGSSGIEIIKRSYDYSVSITAHTGPENKTKSPYLMQTHIHKKGGKQYFSKILVYFFFLQAELLNILELHPISLTLWQCHDTRGEGQRAGGEGGNDSLCDSLTYPFLAKIENNYFPCLGVTPWHLLFFFFLS